MNCKEETDGKAKADAHDEGDRRKARSFEDHCYSTIKALNTEMSERVCKVVAERVSNKYFEQAYFDFDNPRKGAFDVH